MTVPTPPTLAAWLLKHLSSGYHTEPLAGDLIEEYARGRSRAWYWRQVFIAILVSAKRAAARRMHHATRRVFFRLVAEVSTVLAVVSFVDQSRRVHAVSEMWTPMFVGTVVLLGAVALVALMLSRPRFESRRRRTVIKHVAAVFAVAALGAGTLTWADAVRSTCKTDNCLCSKIERTPTHRAEQ